MQLIKLYSDKKSFHTVNFKPGVNFIVGQATKENAGNTQKTYNGVGKSLLIKLIDFCLACESIEDLETKLPNWEFSLEFELKGKKYISTRNTSKQKKIILNGEEISLEEFRDKFIAIVFGIIDPVDFLTWRTLIPRFTKPRKDSYHSFDKSYSKESDYSKQLNTAFLLGLDIDLIEKKKDLKVELDRIDTFKKNLENDEIFKKYFTQNKDIDIEIIDLEDKIKDLKKILESFEVSESYYQIQKDADQLKQEGQLVKNKITLLKNSIRNIEKSLEIKIDIAPETIINLYKETKNALPKNVIKKIEEVNDFHQNLITKRKKRLLENKVALEDEKKLLEENWNEIRVKIDESLQFLGKHKALDEFVAINEKLNSFNSNLEKLKNYKGLLQEYKNKSEEIEIDLKQENIKTNNYLDTVYPTLEKNINTFRLLSKEFYDNKAGGIEIKSNDGKNQIRFNINVQIEDDTSDGVNEVKIFCFDMTLLLTKHNHFVEFVIHDSRLFSNIDPRQVATLFKLANTYSKKDKFQYIATLNQNQIDPLDNFYSKEEYKTFIEDNVILTLTDSSDEARLLGVPVNIDYEK